jgi:hypothetical protein
VLVSAGSRLVLVLVLCIISRVAPCYELSKVMSYELRKL